MTEPSQLRSIGQVAALLGVAPETVRSWGRRYGLAASGRSSGGHRRFTAADVRALNRMQELVATGLSPASAAARVLDPTDSVPIVGPLATVTSGASRPTRRSPAERSSPSAGPGGRVLAVPGGSRRARGLARAVSRLDAATATGLVGEMLVAEGAVRTWEDVLVPVLEAAGLRWSRTGRGVEIEHVLSEVIQSSLQSYATFLPRPLAVRAVLLAGAPEDTHTLPLHILAVALREQRIPSLLLGGRSPVETVLSAAKRTGALGVFVWSQISTGTNTAGLIGPLRSGLRPAALLVLGGPGWDGIPMRTGVSRPTSLGDAVDVFVRAAR